VAVKCVMDNNTITQTAMKIKINYHWGTA